MKKPLWRQDLDLVENLRWRLPKLARKYFAEGTKTVTSSEDWEEMHAFRLQTKRFRYTLELFRPQFGPGLHQRIENLKQVQDLLGEANDYIVSTHMLKSFPGTEKLQSDFISKAELKLKELRTWWGENMETESAQKRWINYLQRYAGRVGASRIPQASGNPPSLP